MRYFSLEDEIFFPISHPPQTLKAVHTRLSCMWELCETRTRVAYIWLPCFKKRECRNKIWMLRKSIYCFPKDWSACPQLLNRNTIWNSLLFSIGCYSYFNNWNLIILGTVYFWIIWFLSSLVILTFQCVSHPFAQCLLSFRCERCGVVLVYGSFFLTWCGLFGRSGMWVKMTRFSLLSPITMLILYKTHGFFNSTAGQLSRKALESMPRNFEEFHCHRDLFHQLHGLSVMTSLQVSLVQ